MRSGRWISRPRPALSPHRPACTEKGGAMELPGKRVVVTGAGQGLGRAYAEGMAREGASVLVNDVDAANCHDVVASIRVAGGTAEGHVGSVADWDDAGAIVSACVEAFGGIDGLVNN